MPPAAPSRGRIGNRVERPDSRPEAARKAASAGNETHDELRPLGIDIEAAPFVALAAIASLALATAAWLRPRTTELLALVAAAMVVFAAAGVHEVFHQADEARTGLAVLVACIAALHLAAAALAATMIRDARRLHGPGMHRLVAVHVLAVAERHLAERVRPVKLLVVVEAVE
jgi:hypothetical protein